MIDLAIQGCGVVSSVGLSAPAACAAIRCGLSLFTETRFMDGNGQWINAAQVPLESSWRGRIKLAHMAARAVQEAISGLNETDVRQTQLLLCLAEPDRPGRIADEDQAQLLLEEIRQITAQQLPAEFRVIFNGHVGGVQAFEMAQAAISSGHCRYCVVAGVDSYLTAGTLAAYDRENRLLTAKNSDGFIPGEAAAAVLLASIRQAPNASIIIRGIGFGRESAHIRSGEPLRADGMVEAIRNSLTAAGKDLGDLDFRICDISGEQYYFKEAALALTRILRKHKQEFDIWHPAECIGETGAAIVPVVLTVAAAAVEKAYSKGSGILCHFANDDGQRAAIVVEAANRKRTR
jgi:3-oxoacyl-[acyl-carrier-protein] synthase-1